MPLGSPGRPRARPESRKRPVGKRQKDEGERKQVEKWKKGKVGKGKGKLEKEKGKVGKGKGKLEKKKEEGSNTPMGQRPGEFHRNHFWCRTSNIS